MQITLRRWILATIEERDKMLCAGAELDYHSRTVLNWGRAFGANEDRILQVYDSTVAIQNR